MGSSTQDQVDASRSEWLANHSLAAATLVYVVICIPAFMWLAGPVGIVGTVDRYTTALALALGGIMIVPIIRIVITKQFAASRVASMGGAGD